MDEKGSGPNSRLALHGTQALDTTIGNGEQVLTLGGRARAWLGGIGFTVLNGFLSFRALYLDIVFSFSPAWSS